MAPLSVQRTGHADAAFVTGYLQGLSKTAVGSDTAGKGNGRKTCHIDGAHGFLDQYIDDGFLEGGCHILRMDLLFLHFGRIEVIDDR